jgi:hypothetical protein
MPLGGDVGEMCPESEHSAPRRAALRSARRVVPAVAGAEFFRRK